MKTFIILVQMLVLLIVGWFTRPAQDDFDRYVSHHSSAVRSVSAVRADVATTTEGCEFRDRWLWVEVTKDRKVVYVGALAHWFDCSMVERNDMSKGVALSAE